MLKKAIRKQALAERLSIDDPEYQTLNKGLVKQFSALDFTNIHTIHIFLPIVEKKEPNSFLLIKWLAWAHPEIKIIVPKANFETLLMSHHEYLGMRDLKKNLYQILEPQKGRLFNGKIDMVLIPLLAFDQFGNRVGYGKGFYDRFLQNLNAQKIGLSLTNAIDKIDDVWENDIRLDFCITPTQTIKF